MTYVPELEPVYRTGSDHASSMTITSLYRFYGRRKCLQTRNAQITKHTLHRTHSPKPCTCVQVDAHMLSRSIRCSVRLSQLIQHVGGIESGIVAQLSGNCLERCAVCIDEKLRLARDCPCVLPALRKVRPSMQRRPRDYVGHTMIPLRQTAYHMSWPSVQ